ncbi:hypothetical protein DFJ63DRAFT_313841 [Scheffersomyces coipomensis]|uniref:uncharacterized protein n=1 Tax=Scheffersomyces coipomensis TaxID=1788519 RepID=UPI00315DE019
MAVKDTSSYVINAITDSFNSVLFSTSIPSPVIESLILLTLYTFIIVSSVYATIHKPSYIEFAETRFDDDTVTSQDDVIASTLRGRSSFEIFMIICGSIISVGLMVYIVVNTYEPIVFYKSLEVIFILGLRILNVQDLTWTRYRLIVSNRPSITITRIDPNVADPNPFGLDFDIRWLDLLPTTLLVYYLSKYFSYNWIIGNLITTLHIIYAFHNAFKFRATKFIPPLYQFKYIFGIYGVFILSMIYKRTFFIPTLNLPSTAASLKILIPISDTHKVMDPTRSKYAYTFREAANLKGPILLISLCLKFDMYNYYKNQPADIKFSKLYVLFKMKKVYSSIVMISFLGGNLYMFNKWYYNPILEIGLCGVIHAIALIRGELYELWKFNDDVVPVRLSDVKEDVKEDVEEDVEEIVEDIDVADVEEILKEIMIVEEEDESDDDDYLINSEDEKLEQVDLRIDKVEFKRYQTKDYDSDDDRELNMYRKRVVIYVFEEGDDEEDEKDDTYEAEPLDEEDDELSDESDYFDEDLRILREDLKKDPVEWYGDDE